MELRLWRNFDFGLVVWALALCCFGIVMINSATTSAEQVALWKSPAARQVAFTAAGLIALVALAIVDYQVYRHLAYLLYAGDIALLVAVLVSGHQAHGSQRWFDLGFLKLEPSEISKLIIIIALARYLSDHEGELHRIRYILGSLVIVAIPMALIYRQPDLGTTVVFAAIWAGMLVMAGVPMLHLGIMAGLAAASAPLAWQAMHGYMKERFIIWLNPEVDRLGEGYNYIQSRISVGSGGLLGKGLTSGTQSQLNYLRVPYTDFIFSVIGEELGFVGGCLLLLLFVFLIFRLLRVPPLARDGFGRLVAAGTASMILFQLFINTGMTIGLVPVTGITLPFISYGGSSLLTLFGCLGLLESVLMHRKKLSFE